MAKPSHQSCAPRQIGRRRGRLGLCLALLLLPCLLACASNREAAEASGADTREIQEGVMSFADRWAAGTRQAGQLLLEQTSDPQARNDLRKRWYYAALDAYDIAAGPYPGIAMLDMMVMTSLMRGITERDYPVQPGSDSGPVLRVLRDLEQDIWSFSEAYLNEQQRASLRGLVDDWLAEHPNAHNASFVRFSDFQGLGRAPTLEEATKQGGFLAPIRDAAQSAEDLRELAERALFLSVRLQEMMIGRAELFGQEMLTNPDIARLFDDIHGFQSSADRYAEVAEDLPLRLERVLAGLMAQLSAEREAALSQALVGIATEREAAIRQMTAGVATERELALDQALAGIRAERLGVLKATAQILYWVELEIRATILQLFLVAACLIVLWFGLRLIYRFWEGRVGDSFAKVLGAALLLLILAIPTLLLGQYLLTLVRPDFSEQEHLSERLEEVIETFHAEQEAPAVSGDGE